MSATNSNASRKTGFKFNNEAIHKAAAIDYAKIGTRTLAYALSPQNFHLSGASVALSADGVFVVVTMPNANTGNLYSSFVLNSNYVSSNVGVNIFWKTTSNTTTQNVKFVSNIACVANGGSSASEDSQFVTQAPSSAANELRKAQITHDASFFSGAQIVGIHIQRDPADAADTLAADVKIVAVVIEYTGRA